jgi:hypothetical protein
MITFCGPKQPASSDPEMCLRIRGAAVLGGRAGRDDAPRLEHRRAIRNGQTLAAGLLHEKTVRPRIVSSARMRGGGTPRALDAVERRALAGRRSSW